MVILVNDYVVKNDTYEYTLMKDTHRQDKEGNKVYTALGHYSSLESAIKGCIKHINSKKLSEGVYELSEAVKIIEDNNQLLSDLLEKHLGGA